MLFGNYVAVVDGVSSCVIYVVGVRGVDDVVVVCIIVAAACCVGTGCCC